MTIILFIIGLIMLTGGAELLVGAASRLAAMLGIPPLVIGLTVVAFGTSFPELAVSVQSSFLGQTDIALGNVVGSNIFNILFILGVSALIIPLTVSVQLIRFDIPIMIGASLGICIMGLDGRIGRMDGILLFTCILLYTGWLIKTSHTSVDTGDNDDGCTRPPRKGSYILMQIMLIVAGLALLGGGSHLLVQGAITIAHAFGVSELVIGLTVVAAGTSLPEVAASVVAAFHKVRDIAVGNVVGSNIFNILCVLGFSSAVSPHGVAVAPTALAFDLPVMTVVAVACLPVFFTGHVIARWEGALFLGYYAAYTIYLVLNAAGSHVLGGMTTLMVVFVIPLTVVTLSVSVYRAMRARR